ncbi:RNA polymerase II elongation factor ELL2-like [Passer domesticus]|uniref:RNA polymerase II elongation factor ELL2-like n=1 Tax=Passer domesticus TaxID=48849 RepID=UPI0030FF1CA7
MAPVRLADIDWSGCAAVYGRPYRDRVIHLLALRDYKEPELLAWLQRDGVRPKEKDSLGKILQQVANLNAKENSFSLKEHLFQTLQTDWPGYSKIERKSLKLILSGDHWPGEPVAVLKHPLGHECFPDILPKVPSTLLHVFSLSPDTEENQLHLRTPPAAAKQHLQGLLREMLQQDLLRYGLGLLALSVLSGARSRELSSSPVTSRQQLVATLLPGCWL